MKVTTVINGVTHEIDLTPEQIAKIESSSLVTTWQQAFEKEKPSYWVSFTGNIGTSNNISICDKTNVPTKKHGKSALALCQLFTIVSCLNKTVEISDDLLYYIYYSHPDKRFTYVSFRNAKDSPIYLHSEELAQHLITHFEPLLKDFYMVD